MNQPLKNEEHFTLLRKIEAFQGLGTDRIDVQLPSQLWIVWGSALQNIKTDHSDDSSIEPSIEGMITCIASVLMESSNENSSEPKTVSLQRDVWAFTIALVGYVFANKQVNPEFNKSMEDASTQISLTSIVAWRPIYASIPKLVSAFTRKLPETQVGSNSTEALLLKDTKHEFRNAISSYNENYERALTKHEEAYSMMQSINPNLPNHREMVVDVNVEIDLKPIMERDMPKIRETLAVLSNQESKAAVSVITQLFACKCEEYRGIAIETLAKMKTEHARKALSRRVSWMSSAPKKEKILIRTLLANEA